MSRTSSTKNGMLQSISLFSLQTCSGCVISSDYSCLNLICCAQTLINYLHTHPPTHTHTCTHTHTQASPTRSSLLSIEDSTSEDSQMDQQETSEDKCKSLLSLEQSGRASLLIICTHVHFSLLCVLTCF